MKCALIIVHNVDIGGFRFEMPTVYHKVIEKKDKDGSRLYWLYVSEGAKTLTISNVDSSIEPLVKYNFGERILRAATYHLYLKNFRNGPNKQYLQISVEPKDATVEVDGRPWRVDEEGYATELLPFGEYSWRVSAPEHQSEAGTITVNNPNDLHKIEVKLLPRYGFVKIDGGTDVDGADIWIDGRRIGTGNMTSERISSGKHVLKVTKKLYELYEEQFQISDGQTIVLRPTLKANFERTTLQVTDSAEIWMDGRKLAEGRWTGPLEEGSYIVECRKPGHTTSQKTIVINSTGEERVIDLPAPDPILGALSIQSSPTGAEVWMDGKLMGQTPLRLSRVLVGEHQFVIRKKDYKDETLIAVVEEGQDRPINVKLGTLFTAHLSSLPEGAVLYLDDKPQGKTPLTMEITSGDYRVRLSMPRHQTFDENIHFDASQPDRLFRLKPILVAPTSVYLDVGGSVGCLPGVSLALGGYFHDFHVEAVYTYCTSKESEYVYWNANQSAFKVGMNGGLRFGWGFRMGTQWRITPQIGGYFIKLKAVRGSNGNGANALSGSIGARISWAVLPYLGFSLTPEYRFRLKASTGYKAMSAVSSDIDGLSKGLNARLAVSVFF